MIAKIRWRTCGFLPSRCRGRNAAEAHRDAVGQAVA